MVDIIGLRADTISGSTFGGTPNQHIGLYQGQPVITDARGIIIGTTTFTGSPGSIAYQYTAASGMDPAEIERQQALQSQKEVEARNKAYDAAAKGDLTEAYRLGLAVRNTETGKLEATGRLNQILEKPTPAAGYETSGFQPRAINDVVNGGKVAGPIDFRDTLENTPQGSTIPTASSPKLVFTNAQGAQVMRTLDPLTGGYSETTLRSPTGTASTLIVPNVGALPPGTAEKFAAEARQANIDYLSLGLGIPQSSASQLLGKIGSQNYEKQAAIGLSDLQKTGQAYVPGFGTFALQLPTSAPSISSSDFLAQEAAFAKAHPEGGMTTTAGEFVSFSTDETPGSKIFNLALKQKAAADEAAFIKKYPYGYTNKEGQLVGFSFETSTAPAPTPATGAFMTSVERQEQLVNKQLDITQGGIEQAGIGDFKPVKGIVETSQWVGDYMQLEGSKLATFIGERSSQEQARQEALGRPEVATFLKTSFGLGEVGVRLGSGFVGGGVAMAPKMIIQLPRSITGAMTGAIKLTAGTSFMAAPEERVAYRSEAGAFALSTGAALLKPENLGAAIGSAMVINTGLNLGRSAVAAGQKFFKPGMEATDIRFIGTLETQAQVPSDVVGTTFKRQGTGTSAAYSQKVPLVQKQLAAGEPPIQQATPNLPAVRPVNAVEGMMPGRLNTGAIPPRFASEPFPAGGGEPTLYMNTVSTGQQVGIVYGRPTPSSFQQLIQPAANMAENIKAGFKAKYYEVFPREAQKITLPTEETALQTVPKSELSTARLNWMAAQGKAPSFGAIDEASGLRPIAVYHVGYDATRSPFSINYQTARFGTIAAEETGSIQGRLSLLPKQNLQPIVQAGGIKEFVQSSANSMRIQINQFSNEIKGQFIQAEGTGSGAAYSQKIPTFAQLSPAPAQKLLTGATAPSTTFTATAAGQTNALAFRPVNSVGAAYPNIYQTGQIPKGLNLGAETKFTSTLYEGTIGEQSVAGSSLTTNVLKFPTPHGEATLTIGTSRALGSKSLINLEGITIDTRAAIAQEAAMRAAQKAGQKAGDLRLLGAGEAIKTSVSKAINPSTPQVLIPFEAASSLPAIFQDGVLPPTPPSTPPSYLPSVFNEGALPTPSSKPPPSSSPANFIPTGKGLIQIQIPKVEVKTETKTEAKTETKTEAKTVSATKTIELPKMEDTPFATPKTETATKTAVKPPTLQLKEVPAAQGQTMVQLTKVLPATKIKPPEQQTKTMEKTDTLIKQKQATPIKERMDTFTGQKTDTLLKTDMLTIQKTAQLTDTLQKEKTAQQTKQAEATATNQLTLQKEVQLTKQLQQRATRSFTPWSPPPTIIPTGGDIKIPPPSSKGHKEKKRMVRRLPVSTFKVQGVRSMYADLASVEYSRAKYGSATSPSLIKRPELWAKEGGRVPTAEQLNAKRQPKTRGPQLGKFTPSIGKPKGLKI